MSEFAAHAKFIVGLFSMMDPVSVIPIMLGLTVGFTSRQRRQTALAATMAVIVILVGAQYSGMWLLDLVGTSLASMQIAGGIIIAWSGVAMMSTSGFESDPLLGGGDASSPTQLGVAPIAVPLLAGPGAITKVVIASQGRHGIGRPLHVTLNIIIVCLVCGLLLLSADIVGKLIGKAGTVIFNRLFGLIVVAIGVELVVVGIATHVHRILG